MANFYPKAELGIDIESLVRRQDELEREINRLRELLNDMKEYNAQNIGRMNERISELEQEVADVRKMLDELRVSLNLIQNGVNTVQQHVSDINAKQDVAITAQDKFISQLWRAFFALLGVITAAGAGLVALLK